MKKLEFPLYRKYPNNRSYFKVFSAQEWVELRVEPGRNVVKYDFKATTLPDRNFLNDMMAAQKAHWVEISENEFNKVAKEVTARS